MLRETWKFINKIREKKGGIGDKISMDEYLEVF